MRKMEIGSEEIMYDFNFTNVYRDKYNKQCMCEECINFRTHFYNRYEEVALFINQFGININYPLEIVDCGIDDEKNKREYIAYYLVKGTLSTSQIHKKIENVDLIFFNPDEIKNKYSNSDMKKPYFIIEISKLYI